MNDKLAKTVTNVDKKYTDYPQYFFPKLSPNYISQYIAELMKIKDEKE